MAGGARQDGRGSRKDDSSVHLIQMIQQDEQSAAREFMEFELRQERPYLFSDLDHSIIERDTAPQERGGLF